MNWFKCQLITQARIIWTRKSLQVHELDFSLQKESGHVQAHLYADGAGYLMLASLVPNSG